MIFLIILAAILFWPTLRVVNKRVFNNSGKKDKILSFITVVTVFSVLIWGANFSYDNYYSPYKRSKTFDPHLWKEDIHSRYTMINDLIDKEKVIGLTKFNTIEILGENFENGPCKNCIGYSTYDPDQSSLVDHEVVVIYFDKNNKAQRVHKEYW